MGVQLEQVLCPEQLVPTVLILQSFVYFVDGPHFIRRLQVDLNHVHVGGREGISQIICGVSLVQLQLELDVALVRLGELGLPLDVQLPRGNFHQSLLLILHQRMVLCESRRGVTLNRAFLLITCSSSVWVYERATLRQDRSDRVRILRDDVTRFFGIVLVVFLTEVHA